MGAAFRKGKRKTKEERKSEKVISKRSTTIDKQNLEENTRDRAVPKLLLLGAGESGKSTLFKQTIKLYGKGFDKASLDGYLAVIHRNILSAMHTLVKQSEILPEELKCRPNPDVKASLEYFNSLKPPHLSCYYHNGQFRMRWNNAQEGKVDAESADHIKVLWKDPGIRNTFSNRSRFQVPDSASYFFEHIDRISKADYSPNYEDILRCRSRTTGIVETEFQIKNDLFKIMDVGGQRSERKKWIHCFEDVTAVIFVAAINEYDQTLYEDNSTNRLMEALDLFDKTCNSKWFVNANIILFLNKRDLFEDKIKKVDLKVCFPDYKDGCNSHAASEYLMNKFKEQNKQPKLKIYGHITCATDTNSVKITLEAVKKVVLNTTLKKSGLT